MLERLDTRAVERVRGEAWDKIRRQLNSVHDALISVSPCAAGELTTIYIKYATPETGPQPFAVLWVKKSTELVLGLTLPADFASETVPFFSSSLKYTGLTRFLRFTPADEIPDSLKDLATAAYRNLLPA